MTTHEIPSVALPNVRMDFQLAVLQDACAQADRYWCNWLWGRPQPNFAPSDALFAAFPAMDVHRVRAAWCSWFTLLTSFDYACALTGRDLQWTLGDYGSSCKKQ